MGKEGVEVVDAEVAAGAIGGRLIGLKEKGAAGFDTDVELADAVAVDTVVLPALNTVVVGLVCVEVDAGVDVGSFFDAAFELLDLLCAFL